jgi:hypothetical protein
VLDGRPGVASVAPQSPSAIADALAAAIGGREGREAVGETREWVRRELSSEAYARRMTTIYERALA